MTTTNTTTIISTTKTRISSRCINKQFLISLVSLCILQVLVLLQYVSGGFQLLPIVLVVGSDVTDTDSNNVNDNIITNSYNNYNDNNNNDCFVCYSQSRQSEIKYFVQVDTTAANENNNTIVQSNFSYYSNNRNRIQQLPLIGLGVGNMDHNDISTTIAVAASNDNSIYLFDTAHASSNEHLVRYGIDTAISNSNSILQQQSTTTTTSQQMEQQQQQQTKHKIFHVVTKVWYTYLGYNRTKLSVQESLQNLQKTIISDDRKKRNNNNKNQYSTSTTIHVHMLLHWPRCRTDISWMDCPREEMDLSDIVKAVGPDPTTNPNSFLQSWTALEDIYIQQQQQQQQQNLVDEQITTTTTVAPSLRSGRQRRTVLGQDKNSTKNTVTVQIASIGVSNFDHNDLNLLLTNCRIKPHLVQDNVWTFVFDPYLRTIHTNNNIHYQAYNVMNGIIQNYDHCPNAYHTLVYVSTMLSSYVNTTIQLLSSQSKYLSVQEQYSLDTFIIKSTSHTKFLATPTQIILSWLVQQNVSIIPRSSNEQHIHDNSPISLYPFIVTWQGIRTGIIQHGTTTTTTIQPNTILYKRLSTIVETSIKALLQQHDLQPIDALFDNTNNPNEWKLYWIEQQHVVVDDEETIPTSSSSFNTNGIRHLITTILPNDIFHTGTHPGHKFVAVQQINNNHANETDYTITAIYGEQQTFTLPSPYVSSSSSSSSSFIQRSNINDNHGTEQETNNNDDKEEEEEEEEGEEL